MIVLSIIGKILLILLKVVGWTLLGILGLILIVLLIVLFLPIHYEMEGEAGNGGEAFDANVHARIHLLLKLIKADVYFRDKTLSGQLKILWIKKNLIGKEEPESGETVSEPLEDLALDLSQDPEEEESAPTQPETIETVPEHTEPEPQETIEPEEPIEAKEEPPAQEEPPTPEETVVSEETAEQEVSEEKPFIRRDPEELVILYGEEAKEWHIDLDAPVFGKIEEVLTGLYQKYEGISEKVQGIILKVQKLLYQAESLYNEFWYYPDRPYLLKLIFGKLLKILNRIRPRKLNINLRYGTGDPVMTARIAGGYGMLSAWCGTVKHYSVDLVPDFEQKMIEGSISFKGKLQGYMIIAPILRIAISRRLWRLIFYIRNRKKQ